ncbi:hypothetical protein FG385_18935 [Amycolatopsis alkalitolerans]|uniref:HTH luxR-type domain-containing protein n=1 Tax=Amycolatopsis alkalitolerans TaxID=2547244 RepID=A0A5C4LX55_9PSEU|nr:hypothetical protein FG385_18935 [Amycolatopsis alkalitolerans]
MAGEPGIGKTRLAEEATRMAAALGMARTWGRAVDDEGSPPFWPFRTALRSLSGDPWPSPAERPEPGAATPEVRAQERFRVFEVVTSYLRSAAGDSGLLVVLDDLQWADASSLRLLVHLVRTIGDARLAVIGTYRDTEVGLRHALQQALGDLAREPTVSRLRLVGLTEAQVAEQLTAVTGAPVTAELTTAISRRSQGNPFYVRELAGALGEADRRADPAHALPAGVRDAVRTRLAKLGDATQVVVSAAAVLGTAVDVAALAHVVGTEPAEVLAALDEATVAGVMHPDRCEFLHDLVRDAARSEVPRATRLSVHLRMAEYLQRRPGAEARPAELAHHWLESVPLGDPGQASRWAERAARVASEQFAWDEAADLYRRAAAVVDEPGRLCDLLIAQATEHLHAHQMGSAKETVLAASRLARSLGDGTRLARATLVLEGVNDLTWSADERSLCEEALTLLPDEDSTVRVRLLAQLSVDHLVGQDPATSGELSGTALAMAERLADPVALHSALHARQIIRSGPDGVHERLELGDRFIAHGISRRDDAAEMWGRLWRFDALVQLGDLGGAEAGLGGISAVVHRMRLPLAFWHLARCRGAIAIVRGRFTDARSYGEQTLALARRGDHLGGLLPAQGYLAMLGMLTGFHGEEDSHPLDGWDHLQSLHGLIAMVHWYAGREEQARRTYATAKAIDELPGFLLMPAAAGLIELADAFGDRPMLDSAYRSLAPYADLFCCGGAGVIATTGSAHAPLGVAAAALGRLDEGVRHLRRAIEADDDAGAPPFAALARYDLARTLARRRRPGDRDEAAALTAQAVATARELGMAPLLDRAGKLAQALRGEAPGPLTRREREIAALVAQGLTNRQIGAAVHISERTAENHVQHILTKLGFTTRAQIATWVARCEG